MARIVNETDMSLPGGMASVQAIDVDFAGPMIYDDTYGDHDESVISSRFHTDTGGMTKDLEDDISMLKTMANENIKLRKPICDWKTSNKTFIEVHNDLKRLGVKNNVFFLALYDRELQGVNPYDPLLSLEMQVRVYMECVINPWYYLREIARIPADGLPIEPGGGVQYQLDRNNLASWYCFLHNIDNYTSKPRQCGKTQDALQKLNYAYHFGASSSTILFFNKDLGLSKENLARMKDQRDLYPKYLQMRIAFDEDGKIDKGIDNITTTKNPVTGNKVMVMPCANSKEMATRLGRGYTSSLAMFDEFDYTNFNTEIVHASVFAYATASKNAIENASCAGRLFLSTPGDLSTRDGKAATDFIRGTKESKGMMVWNDRMFDDNVAAIKKELYSTKYNGVMFIEHSWKQLKKSMQWYERACNLASYNQEIILREICLQRLSGSSQSPFTREQQLYLSAHKKTPKNQIDIRTEDTISTIFVYEKLSRKIPYIIGIDPSDGLAEDNNAMIIINPRTSRVAAEYKCPYISSRTMSKIVTNFMDQYCPNALIVVEANRGRGLLERLSETHYAHRIWYDADRLNQIVTVKTDKYGGIPHSTLTRKVQGFVTGPKSRKLLFALLENMVMEQIDDIYTENVVNELLTLIRKPTGKIEAAPGEHDDCIMAYLIALYVYTYASNLEEFGINRLDRSTLGEKVERPAETEAQYRDRVASALPNIPDKYRGIFEDFLKQRDPVMDARDNARKRNIAESQSFFNMSPMGGSTGLEDDMKRFDQFDDDEETDDIPGFVPPMGGRGMGANMNRHMMYGGAPGTRRDMVSPVFSEDEREDFEIGIINSNFQDEGPSFDPSDYI